LADSYYQINEWCCAAFDELLHLLCDAQPADFMQKTAAAEVRLHAALLSRQPNLAAGADDQAAEATRLTSQRLQAAVNELLVLMTPARWDYGEVGLRTTVEDGRPALGFSAEGDARADLLLNTAELSDFSLVLFLLLAPRVDNQLRLLILDDPLQNMDEMKVCTLARALAGLIAIYPPGWSVLALFHGMDDMERIREEAPSAVYHLPWARPLDTQGVERPIGARTDLGTWQRSTQPLDKLLRDAAQPARRRERPGSILSNARRN
jgi:hypothetical protein